MTQKFAPQVELSGSKAGANEPDGRGLRSGSPFTFTCGTTTTDCVEAPLVFASDGFVNDFGGVVGVVARLGEDLV